MRKCLIKNVGVIGLGMGWEHAEAWEKIGCKVAAVCDPNPERARQGAERFGARAYGDYRHLLDQPDVQAVSIATPDHLHFRHAKDALAARKHVMLEKPMTISLAEAKGLIKAVKASGMQLGVGNVNRFVPQFLHVKALAVQGKLGRLFHLCSDYIHDMRGHLIWTPWRKSRRNPQDFWLAGAIHPLDLLRWVGGEIAEIHLYATRTTLPEFPLDSDFSANLKFASGATGRLWATAGIRRRPVHEVRFSAYGDKGSVETSFGPELLEHLHPRDDKKKDWVRRRFKPSLRHPVAAELRAFRAALAAGRRPEVDVIDGARSMAALEAGLKSARTGRPVKVELIPR